MPGGRAYSRESERGGEAAVYIWRDPGPASPQVGLGRLGARFGL